MFQDQNKFILSTDDVNITASIVPWDTDVLGFPVVSIDLFQITHNKKLNESFRLFEDWLDNTSVQLVTCRLKQKDINTSVFLQDKGFHLIETVLHPKLSNLQSIRNLESLYDVSEANKSEVSDISSMASKVFGHERYHLDPKIDSRDANLRYARWVKNSYADTEQKLLKITSDENILGFFVTEIRPKKLFYWHLTGLNPEYIGHGIGPDVWRAMILFHKSQGMEGILTTISAGNIPVLNLYSSLNFRFAPPEVTLHWHRQQI